MMRLLWQIEDLLAGVRGRNGVLTLSGCNRVIFFTIIIGIEEFLKPLNEIKIVLKSAFNQFLHRNNLKRKEKKKTLGDEKLESGNHFRLKRKKGPPTLSTFIRLKDACNSLKL